jgi:hypothetical protein
MIKFLQLTFFAMIFNFQVFSGELIHRSLEKVEKSFNNFIWEESEISPFDELIVSWDASRPENGQYLIQISLFTNKWSPWLDYASWSALDQHTFKQTLPDANLQVFQDAAEVLNGNKATGFKVQVLAKDGASLINFRALHACASDMKSQDVNSHAYADVLIDLEVPGLSQMALQDKRNNRLCSPTSACAVVRYLSKNSNLSAIDFANNVWDSNFDIFGNWILNTAQASQELGEGWHCFVARFNSFNQIIDQLKNGYPVVVSVKGPLPGSALPYESGHLLVVKGFDSKEQTVLCMDPAFPTDASTIVKYHLEDFLNAWKRRKGTAYVFYQ